MAKNRFERCNTYDSTWSYYPQTSGYGYHNPEKIREQERVAETNRRWENDTTGRRWMHFYKEVREEAGLPPVDSGEPSFTEATSYYITKL